MPQEFVIQEVVKVVSVLGILWVLLAAACFPMIVATWAPIIQELKEQFFKEHEKYQVNRQFKAITRNEGRGVR